jgi:hypothetical protein
MVKLKFSLASYVKSVELLKSNDAPLNFLQQLLWPLTVLKKLLSFCFGGENLSADLMD